MQTMQNFCRNHVQVNTNQIDYQFELHDSFLIDIESFITRNNSNNNKRTNYSYDNDSLSDNDSTSLDLEHLDYVTNNLHLKFQSIDMCISHTTDKTHENQTYTS